MKLEVNQDLCIGCGACQAICPEVFQINDEGYAEVVADADELGLLEDAVDAKESCPGSAIQEVATDGDEGELSEDIVDTNESYPSSTSQEVVSNTTNA